MAELDVYRDWLKIEATNRPLNYYQLLKFNKFVDDPALIRQRYRDLNAYVRKFATGEFIEESQALLNELAKAMLCLTDAERKAEYDLKLGRKQTTTETTDAGGRRSLETILRSDGSVTSEQIKKARSLCDAIGVDLHQALIQQKACDPEKIMVAYAESVGLPFVNLDDVPVDEYYAPQINPVTARQNSFVPVMSDMGKLILASPEPIGVDVEDELRMLFEMPVRCAICMPQQVNAAIAKHYPRDAVQQIVKKAPSGETTVAPKSKPKAKKSGGGVELSQAAKKNRVKLSIVCFNFGVMVGALGANFALKHASTGKMILCGLALGALAGGIAWICAPREVEE